MVLLTTALRDRAFAEWKIDRLNEEAWMTSVDLEWLR